MYDYNSVNAKKCLEVKNETFFKNTFCRNGSFDDSVGLDSRCKRGYG